MFGKKKTTLFAKTHFAGLEYEQVVRKYADMVTRICVMRCGNVEDAKDCFQNVFIKLYTADKDFETEEYLKAWLIQVAIHQCTDFHRQAWNRKVALEDDISKFEELGVVTDGSTQGSELFLLVKQLPEKYSNVIYLYYYEEYSISEIAKMLDSNENTIKSILKRGRDKLKEMLGGVDNELVIRI
ncbi:MAG: RNA polymerase sigma factor [Bacteroides sp.]|nr:sigma-70 family RNA polymerase sigma factor [Clostridia bacterium]